MVSFWELTQQKDQSPGNLVQIRMMQWEHRNFKKAGSKGGGSWAHASSIQSASPPQYGSFPSSSGA